MARLTSDLVISLTDNISRSARGVEGSLRRVNTAMDLAAGKRAGLTAVDALGMTQIAPRMLASAAAFAAPTAAAYAASQAYTDFAAVERRLSRTGLKLGASRDVMRDIQREMAMIANKYAVPVEEVMSSFDSLAESGFSLAEARANLASVVKATQGLGGTGQDTVNTFDAARKSIGLAASDAERFFDIIAAGGAAGKFEGSDLARYLPSLLPVAARQGYRGLEGATRLVAFLEVMRDYVGSSEEAATATADIFEKISSPDVIKNFRKFGVNLEERMAKARDNGEDVLLVLGDIIREITKGDTTKLSQLFGDRDSRRAANVLVTASERVVAAQQALRESSSGTIQANVNVVTEDAQAKLDKLSNSWASFKTSVGAGIAVGATPALDAFTTALDRGQAYDAGLKRYEAEGGSKDEARSEFNKRYGEARPDFDWWNPADLRERSQAFVQAMREFGEGVKATPFAELDRILAARTNGRFPNLDESRRRADAWAEGEARRNAGNLDGQPVRNGVPIPGSRDGATLMSEADQRAAYGRSRMEAERITRIDHALEASVDRIRGVTERIEAAVGGTLPRTPSARDMAIDAARGPGTGSTLPADRGGRVIPGDLGRSTGTIPVPSARPDIAAEVARQSSEAQASAEAAGQRIKDAFNVTVVPKVDDTSMQSAIGAAQTYAAILRQIAGQQSQIRRDAQGFGSGMRSRVDYSGLHEDIEN